MNITTFNDVTPSRGHLSSLIFENENIGLPRTLFLSISIDLKPFSYDDEKQETRVVLDWIQIPLKESWTEILEKNFTFPKNPIDGYVDGSVYLGSAHNPADTTYLRFTKDDDTVFCTAKIHFDFGYEGLTDIVNTEVEWTFPIDFEKEAIDLRIKEYYAQPDGADDGDKRRA